MLAKYRAKISQRGPSFWYFKISVQMGLGEITFAITDLMGPELVPYRKSDISLTHPNIPHYRYCEHIHD
jgi:hypothetical protein